MTYKGEEELQEKAKVFIKYLNKKGIQGNILPHSFRDYTVKIQVKKDGKSYGNINLYYSPKKVIFKLRTHELQDKSIAPDLESYWDHLEKRKHLQENNISSGVQIYVDGSYINGSIGYGAVIIHNGEVVEELSGEVTDPLFHNMNQVGGELYAVYRAVEWCHRKQIKEFSLFYDYEGIEKWATGKWKANKRSTHLYQQDAKRWGLDVNWRKVESHSGEYWNDKADQLAKDGARGDKKESKEEEDKLQNVERFANSFIHEVKKQGINAHFDKIYNDSFARIKIEPSGYFDIYDKRNRSLYEPYLHNFQDRKKKKRIRGLWLKFINRELHTKDEEYSICLNAINHVDHYYQTLKPYRDMDFDFSDFIEALELAFKKCHKPLPDLKEKRFDFESLEAHYQKLQEEMNG